MASSGGWPWVLFWATLLLVTGLLLISGYSALVAADTQQALLGDDFSLTNFIVLIVTLIAVDVVLSLLKRRSLFVSRLINGGPTVLVEHGRILYERLRHARLIEADLMEAARSS